jgi:hypothetical protein
MIKSKYGFHGKTAGPAGKIPVNISIEHQLRIIYLHENRNICTLHTNLILPHQLLRIKQIMKTKSPNQYQHFNIFNTAECVINL